jgi:uncharacterized membrane protein
MQQHKNMIKISLLLLISSFVVLFNGYQVLAQGTCSFGSTYDPHTGLVDCKPEGTAGFTDYTPIGIQGYIMGILNVLFPFLGIVAVLFIVISGFKMVVQSHNEQKAKEAQKGLTWAIIGLLATILAYAIITSIIRLIYSVV